MTQYRPLFIVSHPRYLEHDTGSGDHPENPDRLRFIDRQLRQSPVFPAITEKIEFPVARSMASKVIPTIIKEVRVTTCMFLGVMPWSMMTWISRGMARSVATPVLLMDP